MPMVPKSNFVDVERPVTGSASGPDQRAAIGEFTAQQKSSG